MYNSGFENMQSLVLFNAKQSGMKFENLVYNRLRKLTFEGGFELVLRVLQSTLAQTWVKRSASEG